MKKSEGPWWRNWHHAKRGLSPAKRDRRALKMFYYVYILYSEKDGKLYIGYSDNLKKRVKKHEEGFVRATKYRRPVRLIHYEAYRIESDAKRREKYLKGGKGHKDIKIQLKDVLEKINYNF